ncbi:MAG TPA: sensor domain-containing diguanylate cyclase [Acidobacteriaceae bacterium]|jgi:diguanylate cyclase (GGDEF)-like protein|nr:sensor domain-containing diguanylate cyclase [Acidobacteriaceae bacterium]
MADRPTTGNQSFQDLKVFHEVARALTSSLDLDSILGAIMQQMEQFFAPEAWSLLIVDEQQKNLYYAVAAGKSASRLSDVRIAIGEGIAGWVAEHGESLIVPETVRDRRFPMSGENTGSSPVRSVICIPLRWRQRTLGVIELLNYRVTSLTDYTIGFLHVLCDYAAIAVQNARSIERIQELTITDDCTGLYNSRHLASVLDAETERSRRFHLPYSLVFMDLDRFKQVNDRHGHLVGSWLLGKVAQTVRQNIRGVDSAFRYGGDEFIVLLPQTGKDAALEVTQRLMRAIRQTRYRRPEPESLELSVSASFGLASYPDDGSAPQEIIRAADEMMYLVKNHSRDSIAVAQRGRIVA